MGAGKAARNLSGWMMVPFCPLVPLCMSHTWHSKHRFKYSILYPPTPPPSSPNSAFFILVSSSELHAPFTFLCFTGSEQCLQRPNCRRGHVSYHIQFHTVMKLNIKQLQSNKWLIFSWWLLWYFFQNATYFHNIFLSASVLLDSPGMTSSPTGCVSMSHDHSWTLFTHAPACWLWCPCPSRFPPPFRKITDLSALPC